MVQKREFLIQICPSIVHMGTTYHTCFYLQMVVALPDHYGQKSNAYTGRRVLFCPSPRLDFFIFLVKKIRIYNYQA